MNYSMKPFNAIEHLEELRQDNFTEKQSEVIVKMVEQQAQMLQEQNHELDNLKSKELASKADLTTGLHELKLKLQAQIEQTRTEVHKSKYEIIIWTSGFLIVSGLIQHFFK